MALTRTALEALEALVVEEQVQLCPLQQLLLAPQTLAVVVAVTVTQLRQVQPVAPASSFSAFLLGQPQPSLVVLLTA